MPLWPWTPTLAAAGLLALCGFTIRYVRHRQAQRAILKSGRTDKPQPTKA